MLTLSLPLNIESSCQLEPPSEFCKLQRAKSFCENICRLLFCADWPHHCFLLKHLLSQKMMVYLYVLYPCMDQ